MKNKFFVPVLALFLMVGIANINAAPFASSSITSVSSKAVVSWWYKQGYKFGRLDALSGLGYGSSGSIASGLPQEQKDNFWAGYNKGYSDYRNQ